MLESLKSWKGALIVFLLISSKSLQAQINYEKGYFINKEGQRIECLIQSLDWSFNPIEIDYKLTPEDRSKTLRAMDVKELVIYDFAKYVGARVKWDVSSDRFETMSNKRSPEWLEQDLFLKVLVEGEATLYSLIKEDARRFFYKIGESSITQLVYKKYEIQAMTDGKNITGVNSDFLGQLNADVRCGRAPGSKMPNLTYNAKVLTKYFEEFNKCKGAGKTTSSEGLNLKAPNEISVGNSQSKLKQINPTYFSITPGLNFSSISGTDTGSNVYMYNAPGTYKYSSKLSFRLGFEAEFIISRRNRWGIIAEPTFRSYSSNESTGNTYVPSSIRYTSVEIPIGLRHHSPLGDNSNFFINGAVVLDLSLTSSVKSNPFNFAIGAGFSGKLISFEARLFSARKMHGFTESGSANFYNTALILGVKLSKAESKK